MTNIFHYIIVLWFSIVLNGKMETENHLEVFMKKVLVVDDEESIRTLLQFNLQKEGYQVTLAEDGQKG